MGRTKMLSSFIALTLASGLATGCSLVHKDGGAFGSAEVLGTTGAALSASDVVSVTLTVAGADLSQPIVSSLVPSATGWQTDVTSIPAGTGYDFTAIAYDATGTAIFRGDAQPITIAAGETAQVALVLQAATPSTYQDDAPVIDGLAASTAVVAPSTPVAVTVTATDALATDTLSYAWSASGGSFEDPASPIATWVSPATLGPQTLTITVTDSQGALATMNVVIDVQAQPTTGGAAVSITVDPGPSITTMQASPSVLVVGQPVSLSVVASDPGAPAMTYGWSTGCQGTFAGQASPTATFTLAQAPSQGECSFTVAIQDGSGGSAIGSLGVQVGAAIAPTFDDAGLGASSEPQADAGGLAATGGCTVIESCNPRLFVWSQAACRCVGNGSPSVNLCVEAPDPYVACGNTASPSVSNSCDDPQNCGNCGVVCPSGVCSNGACE